MTTANTMLLNIDSALMHANPDLLYDVLLGFIDNIPEEFFPDYTDLVVQLNKDLDALCSYAVEWSDARRKCQWYNTKAQSTNGQEAMLGAVGLAYHLLCIAHLDDRQDIGHEVVSSLHALGDHIQHSCTRDTLRVWLQHSCTKTTLQVWYKALCDAS